MKIDVFILDVDLCRVSYVVWIWIWIHHVLNFDLDLDFKCNIFQKLYVFGKFILFAKEE